MEYTIWASISVVLVTVADLTLGARLTRRGAFWLFLAVMFAFKLAVNGYLTWRPIVMYGEAQYLGLRIITIPVEDFLFGYSLILLTVTVWEKLKRRNEGSHSR